MSMLDVVEVTIEELIEELKEREYFYLTAEDKNEIDKGIFIIAKVLDNIYPS